MDVIHGSTSAFRVKIDVVPGRTAEAWFLPRLLGDFDILCSVICGTDHSAMLSKVRVLPEDEFKRWYFSDESASRPARAKGIGARKEDRGAILLRDKGCLVCHSLDGGTMVGPTFKGLFKADAAFLKRGILEPEAFILDG